MAKIQLDLGDATPKNIEQVAGFPHSR